MRKVDPEASTRTPRRHRRRWILGGIALVVVGALGGALLTRGGPDVGHFTSAAGYREYLAAYDEVLGDGPRPDATRDVRTDFGIVHMLRYDGPDPDADPLVLLPGTQSGAPMWAGNIASLTTERTVWVVDLLGQPGLSVQSRPIVTAADNARWLAQALKTIPGHPSVLGHSFGGWLAMNLAVHEPTAASSIVVVDPVLTFADLAPQAIIRSIPASVPWTPRSWRDAFASWTANDAPASDLPVGRMIEAGMQNYSLGTPAPARFSTEQLKSVEVPVLAIMAGKSRMHDAASAAAFAKATMPDATVLTYANASHAITGEYPDRLAHDVDAFLDGSAGQD